MRNAHPLLDAAEVAARLAQRPHWRLAGASLERDLRFESFQVAFGFMTAVALAAERLDHHPDWHNVYRRVRIRLSTHDAGGVTALDFELAAIIDTLAATFAAVDGVDTPAP